MVQTLQGSSLEVRVARFNELQNAAPEDVLRAYRERHDMSWVYHDSALEGVVYSMDELRSSAANQVVSDAALIPAYDEIRNHLLAIELAREFASRKRFRLSLDIVKKLYAQLAPEELEGKAPPKYRKDMPLHRLYFHEIAPPEKISYRMRSLIQWVNAAETRRSTHITRLAAKAHHQLLHIYPFPQHSGKVARLTMNVLLMSEGYPPAILHATERQRYYEALKHSEDATARLVQQALVTSVESGIRFFEEH